MTPYYEEDGITIFHSDCREVDLPHFDGGVMVTDPPYGISYESGRPRLAANARSISGDSDTSVRDSMLERWAGSALVFGTWKTAAPACTSAVLVWDQDGALDMGDLAIPWKPSWQAIYVIGRQWNGRRDCGSVLRCPPEQSMGRYHPHQKPVRLLSMLLAKCIEGAVVDPFMGSGSTLVAAKRDGRRAIGVDVDERYCEVAAKRLAQGVLDFGAAS